MTLLIFFCVSVWSLVIDAAMNSGGAVVSGLPGDWT